MAKRGLDEVYRCAAIEGVRSVRMTEPVRTDSLDNPSSLSGPPHDDADPPAVQGLSAPGPKNRFLGFGRSTPAHQFAPNLGGQGEGPRPAILAEDRNLAGVASSM